MSSFSISRRQWALLAASALTGTKRSWAQKVKSVPDELPPPRVKKPAGSEEDAAPTAADIHVDVELVNLLFNVRDRNTHALIPGLTEKDFMVREDGKDQTIAHFSRDTDLPLNLGMLVDVSMSQFRLIETERSAASGFFSKVIRPKDQAFLIAFGHDTDLLQDFTNSVPKLQSALDALKGDSLPRGMGRGGGQQGGGQQGGGYPGGGYPGGGGGGWPGMGGGRRRYPGGGYPGGGYPGGQRGGQQGGVRRYAGTLLFDAVYLAAHDEIGHKTGRKALILITDGEDRFSHYGRSEAIEAAQRADAIVYSIYYVDEKMYQRRGSAPLTGKDDLRRMSEETGGSVFTVDKDHTLSNVFQQIQDEMRSQYSLGYKSTNSDRNGEYREVAIVPRNERYEVQGRKGYYATAARAQ